MELFDQSGKSAVVTRGAMGDWLWHRAVWPEAGATVYVGIVRETRRVLTGSANSPTCSRRRQPAARSVRMVGRARWPAPNLLGYVNAARRRRWGGALL